MKFFAFLVISLSACFAFATPVDGTLFYKLPSGDIADRQVTLVVPAKGQGEVVLSGKKFEWKAKEFWSEKTTSGLTIFFAAFQPEFMEHKTTIVLQGTYINGNHRILYYGDFFQKAGHDPIDRDLKDFAHGGGFMFDFTTPVK